jgi:glutamate synthase (NADPH/NADH) small chain
VRAVRCRPVAYPTSAGVGPRPQGRVTGAETEFPADLVLVAIGFTGVEPDPIHAQLGLAVEAGTIAVGAGGATAVPGVFAAGDCVRGADLIVTAVAAGRAGAAAINAHLARVAAAPAA